MFEAAGAVDGLLDVDGFLLGVALNQARWREVTHWAELGIQHAQAAGRRRSADRFATMLSNAFVWGPHPVREGLDRIAGLLAEARSRSTEIWHLAARATLLAYAGDRAEAEAALAELERVRAEIGLPDVVGDFRLSVVRRFLGDFETSLLVAARASDRLGAVGETGLRSTVVLFAAQACLELGQDDRAFEFAEQGRQLGAEDDVVTQALWRAVEAIVLARRGDHAGAERAQRRGRRALERRRRDARRGSVGRAGGVPRARRASRGSPRGGPRGLRVLGREGVRQRHALGGALDDALVRRGDLNRTAGGITRRPLSRDGSGT